MSLGHCCMSFCFVTFGVYIDIEKKSLLSLDFSYKANNRDETQDKIR